MQKVFKRLRETAASSWGFFRRTPLVQDITVFDFAMQLASAQLWHLYLAYTAGRCFILVAKYAMAGWVASSEDRSTLRKTIWKQAQLYSGTKVAGILVSQGALVASGFSTLGWALCVLAWGGVLASVSVYAHHRSLTDEAR